MVNLIFSIGFGTWITFETVYRHKTENKVIKDQVYDIGAFGYGSYLHSFQNEARLGKFKENTF